MEVERPNGAALGSVSRSGSLWTGLVAKPAVLQAKTMAKPDSFGVPWMLRFNSVAVDKTQEGACGIAGSVGVRFPFGSYST